MIRRTAIAFLCEILSPKRQPSRVSSRAGFVPGATDFELRDASRIARFFAFDFPSLPSHWEVSVTPRLEKAKSDLEPVAPAIEIVRSGEDWFEMKYSVATAAGEGIPLAEVQRLLRSGQSQTRLTNGKIAVLDPDALEDFEQVLRDADPRQSQPGIYRLKKIQAGYLTNTAEEIGASLIGASAILRAEPRARLARARSNRSCAIINVLASAGWPRSRRRIWAGSWRTRWVSAKRSKRSRFSSSIVVTVRL